MADNFFKTQRAKVEKTLFQIAVETGYTPSAVRAWEINRGTPSLRKLAELAKAYEVSEKRMQDAIVEQQKQPSKAGAA